MHRLKAFLYGFFALLIASGGLRGQTNRVFVFPSGVNSNVTVLDATTLASVTAIPVTRNVLQALALPDGSKYYIIANSLGGTGTIRVVNAAGLTVTKQLDLSANASAAAMTPDGRRLLVSAGTLHIIDTATDTELSPAAVGGGPTDIAVSNDSTRAYVLSTGGNVISVVNLTNNTVAQISITYPLSMALTPDDSRLLVLAANGITLINTANNNVSATLSVSIAAGKLLVTPDSSRVILVNRGVAPLNISQIIELRTQTQTPIGTANQAFDQIVIADNSTAFGIVTGTNKVARINLTSGVTTEQTYGLNTRAIDISPSGKAVFLASFVSGAVSRLDVASNLVTATANLAVAPTGIAAVFPPPTANAAQMEIAGGDRQNVIAGQTAVFPLSVRVTTSDGSPVFNAPVTFATAATGVTITPAQPSRTNSRGIAQASVSAAAASSSSLQSGEAAGESIAGARAADPVEQGVQSVTVTAISPGATGVTFTLTVGSGSGILKVSGDYQIARPNQLFPLPLVVRVTDETGFPVPQGTAVSFFAGNLAVLPPSQTVLTDADGIAQAQFSGGTPPAGFTTYQTTVTAWVATPTVSGNVTFYLQTSYSVPEAPEVYSGDQQSCTVGASCLAPLIVRVTNSFGAPSNIGVYWKVISGPAGSASALLDPAISVTDGGGFAATMVTIGPTAGLAPIIIQATLPGIQGAATFTLHATGGPPQTVTILQGNNQKGGPRTMLPLALRVRVADFSGNSVPLPSAQYPLTFTVGPAGAATFANFFQQSNGEASVLVNLGTTPGPFTVTASAGNGQAVFNLEVLQVLSAVKLVSGNNQQVSVGATSAAQLVARAEDAQGNPVGGVEVTFSGPSVVSLVPAQGATGNPLKISTGADGRAAVAVRLGAGAQIGPLTITATASVGSVSFTVNVIAPVPLFEGNAIVNAASFRAGMVAGGLATLFGRNLSLITGVEQAGAATSYKGVTVTIQGRQVPLLAVGNVDGQEQISFQVPFDLAAPATARVEVNNNGSITGVDNVPLLRVQPGIFEYVPQGGATKYAAAVAVKADGAYFVIGPNNPVSRGDVVLLFLTGMGATLPILQTGQAGPVPAAVTYLNPTVGIGGKGTDVLFSGYAPGFIGLYQLNVRVPPDAPTGSAVSVDVIVEREASQTSRIAVQ